MTGRDRRVPFQTPQEEFMTVQQENHAAADPDAKS